MAQGRQELRWSGVALSALICLAGCNDTTIRSSCGSNGMCPAGLHCVMGNCICTSNSDCAAGQTCNPSGFCQSTLGCQTSLDCPTGTFCDTTTGNCIDQSHCTADIQCKLNNVCDSISFKCTPGCREVGDCELGDVCQCQNGSMAPCGQGQLGTCITGPCGDNSYCAFGDVCTSEVDGGTKSCTTDTRGPFCQPCTVEAGQEELCAGSTPNFCLVDTSKSFAGADFCGVDCSKGQECPNGFECDDVLILTEQTCGSTGMQCPLRPAPTCNSDSDCANARGGACDTTKHQCVCVTNADCPGGECDPVSGQCRSSCIVGEGQQQGFCTCLEDSDCPNDACNSQDQRCAIQKTDCDPSNPSTCPPIFCKKVADPLSGQITGYCYIGQNCAPVNGVTCDQVLSGH